MQFKAISVVLVSLVALAAAAPIRHEPESGMINEVGKRAKPAGYSLHAKNTGYKGSDGGAEEPGMAAGVDRRGERDGADDMGGHEEHGGNDGHEEHDLEDTNRLADRRSYAESVQGEDAVVEDLRQRTDMAEHSWYGSYKPYAGYKDYNIFPPRAESKAAEHGMAEGIWKGDEAKRHDGGAV